MISQNCLGTVLVCDEDVTPMMRVWCVFEVQVAQLLRRRMLPDRTDKRHYFLDITAPVICRESAKQNEVTTVMTMLQDAVGGCWNEVTDKEGIYFPLKIATKGVNVDCRK